MRKRSRSPRRFLDQNHPHTATSLENLALLEFDLDRIDEAKAFARQAAAAELTILSKIGIQARRTFQG